MIINISIKKLTILFITALVIILPRVWMLGSKPPLIVDEPANIRDIRIIISKGLSVTDFHWDFSKSRIVHILPVLLIKLGFPDDLLALRTGSVILSILSLIPFYYICRKIAGEFISLLTTLLLSCSYYYLQFSRVGWTDVIMNVLLGLTLFALILKMKEHPKNSHWLAAVAGAVASLIFYSYRSGIILIGTAFIFLIDKTHPKKYISLLKNLLLFTFAFMVLSAPWIFKIIQNSDKYNLRLNVVSVTNKALPFEGSNTRSELYMSQVVKTFNAWVLINRQSLNGSEDPRYLPQGYAVVNIFIKLIFWIGLVSGLFAIKKYYPLYIIIFMSLLGQILTVDPPNGARGFLMLPAIYLLFGLGLSKIYNYLGSTKFLRIGLSVITAAFCLYDVYFYFYWMNWIKV